MSESEKKKRRLYQQNREKWIFAQAVIVGVLTIALGFLEDRKPERFRYAETKLMIG